MGAKESKVNAVQSREAPDQSATAFHCCCRCCHWPLSLCSVALREAVEAPSSESCCDHNRPARTIHAAGTFAVLPAQPDYATHVVITYRCSPLIVAHRGWVVRWVLSAHPVLLQGPGKQHTAPCWCCALCSACGRSCRSQQAIDSMENVLHQTSSDGQTNSKLE
jgi:hypothetical protein